MERKATSIAERKLLKHLKNVSLQVGVQNSLANQSRVAGEMLGRVDGDGSIGPACDRPAAV
jgi:hypothetical protein